MPNFVKLFQIIPKQNRRPIRNTIAIT